MYIRMPNQRLLTDGRVRLKRYLVEGPYHPRIERSREEYFVRKKEEE